MSAIDRQAVPYPAHVGDEWQLMFQTAPSPCVPVHMISVDTRRSEIGRWTLADLQWATHWLMSPADTEDKRRRQKELADTFKPRRVGDSIDGLAGRIRGHRS